jgi:hypothetical protein
MYMTRFEILANQLSEGEFTELSQGKRNEDFKVSINVDLLGDAKVDNKSEE